MSTLASQLDVYLGRFGTELQRDQLIRLCDAHGVSIAEIGQLLEDMVCNTSREDEEEAPKKQEEGMASVSLSKSDIYRIKRISVDARMLADDAERAYEQLHGALVELEDAEAMKRADRVKAIQAGAKQ